MDSTTRYRQILTDEFRRQADAWRSPPTSGCADMLAIDPATDQFLLLELGWKDGRRVRHTYLHAHLSGGKVWIEEDGSEEGLATRLMRAGVPRHDIVLAFHPPELRHLTDFAVA